MRKMSLIPTRLVTGWWVCINYLKLNEATRKDHFPLPFMDQMLERLTGNEYYCFLDGFFGCEDTNLCLNWEKSHFMVKEGIVLSHKISKNRIEVDKAKVDVIAKLPHPTTIKGAVLGQRHEKHFRPIHYVSKTMTDVESNYTITEKEMLAVVLFDNYIMQEDPYIDEKTLDRARDEKFAQWFKEHIQSNGGNKHLKVLARGPMRYVESHKEFFQENEMPTCSNKTDTNANTKIISLVTQGEIEDVGDLDVGDAYMEVSENEEKFIDTYDNLEVSEAEEEFIDTYDDSDDDNVLALSDHSSDEDEVNLFDHSLND
nr:hypothetical protein [Tanacetum cinerariifolium]